MHKVVGDNLHSFFERLDEIVEAVWAAALDLRNLFEQAQPDRFFVFGVEDVCQLANDIGTGRIHHQAVLFGEFSDRQSTQALTSI